MLAGARAEAPFSFETAPGKLPKTVVPLDYDIALRPNVSALTFTGRESVSVRVTTGTSMIVLNTLGLHIAQASVDGHAVSSVVTDDKKQTTTLHLAAPVATGTHAIRLSFAGKIGEQPQGLFYTKFQTSGGERTMLATQMESTDARRMFPSWDEPAFRATYRLQVSVPKTFDAVSNMPASSTTITGDTKTVTFARTPKMASYLVVLCAGEFGYIQGVSDGVKVRVVAPKGREQNGRYALDAAERLLAYYDDYFGIKYPLPKLDLIAVPGGFPGAMENWGGITFTQGDLLFDPAVQPDSAKEGIFQTVAHEMSHQWFGDLVTMAWWDNLWLNEGFADWMQTKATDHFNPDWHLWQRVNGDVETAMATDGQMTTHPVQTPIEDETQADAAFDEITYQKGGAFIRMTEAYLGEAVFRDGIRQYMRANAYSNTTSANLYAALSAASHQDVATFAKAWTLDPGFPLVTADETCTNGRTSIALSQQRFFYEPDQTSSQLWQIPLRIAPALSPQGAQVTLMANKTQTVSAGPCDGPVLVNAGASGYFRVQYDATTSAALVNQIARLAPDDRVRVLADTQALVVAQKAPPGAFLQTVSNLGSDDNLAVWETTLSGLRRIADFEVGHPGLATFDAYRRSVLRPVFERIGGWAPSSSDAAVASLQQKLIEALGAAGDQEIIAQARVRYAKFRTDPASLPPNLRPAVLNVVGTYADAPTWDQMHAGIKQSKSTEEALMYVTALCHARDPELAQRCLEMSLNGDIPAEAGPVNGLFDLVTVATRARQPQMSWAFYKANAPKLQEHFSEFEQVYIGTKLLPLFWNAAPQAELEAYIKAHMPPGLPQTAQVLHLLDLTIATANRVVPEVDAWVSTKGAGTTAAGR